jgi:GNAT superfamily N-acetyltransferase
MPDGNPTKLTIKSEQVEHSTWFRAFIFRQQVGEVAVRRTTPHVWYYEHGFVEEAFRRQGIFRRLFDASMAYTELQKPYIITGFCNRKTLPIFEERGFQTLFSSNTYRYDEWFVVKEYV